MTSSLLKTMNYVSKTVNCALKTVNCALKTVNCALKMMNFEGELHAAVPLLLAASANPNLKWTIVGSEKTAKEAQRRREVCFVRCFCTVFLLFLHRFMLFYTESQVV